jgi:membrane-bound lytic murein transglycosylase C
LISIDFPLADDHIKKRALKYVDIVIPESKNRNLEHELIFALIETESSFNPYAKSPVPAFGLMQLVPITAGRDAFRLVHKKDIVPTDKFLYNPKNNIVLGCAYLYILFNKYLDEIDDIESRKWCVIAAYNTGIGNIFEAFAGKFSKHRYNSRQIWKLAAFEKINQMSSSQVFNYLSENLKYSETRAYIEKVRSRIPKYKTGS